MKYPEFFERVESITLKDPLAEFLGAFEEGIISFSYLDAVKSAGHSCPTIAGAYLMAREGLKALYKDEVPVRGEIKVFLKEGMEEGTTGVIANLFSLITGATTTTGFKGLKGHFDRRNLLFFNEVMPLHVKMQRVDNLHSIEMAYDPNTILPDARMNTLMPKLFSDATLEERLLFGALWQERVRNILENCDKVLLLK
ncbi:MAG: hypothetical protein KBE79_02955 [Sulfurospirillum sp.]|jgi:hypothetical protein|nr:hypothetical protein [Sulfurospirillum sp.]MBP9612538.1 hypothetical protein [Sulfurospirillum sp.]